MLVGKPLSRTSKAALYLVGEQECAGGVAEFARGGEELGRYRVDTTFSLNRFYTDRADIIGKLRSQVIDVVKTHELNVRHYRSEWGAILLLVRGCDRAHRAAVEAVLEREKFRAELLAVGSHTQSVRAGELQRCLPCLSTAVAEKHPIKAADLRQAEREVRCALMVVEVRCMQQASTLISNCLFDRGMRIAKRRHSDTAQQVEIVMAIFIAQIDALSAHEKIGVPLICLEKQLALRSLY